ncbi:MAG: transposase [Candidatus Adiutrix intracellularis]|jgi:putative transposase|nr:transposase [Candidatus Adiutrix intracellularis]
MRIVVVFTSRYHRQGIYGKLKVNVGKILRDLCKRESLGRIEVKCYSDHIHIFIKIPLKDSVSEVIGYLNEKLHVH